MEFELHSKYGDYDAESDSWNGMVAAIMNDQADVATGALSASEERHRVIDFTQPWLYHGISIMEKTVSAVRD